MDPTNPTALGQAVLDCVARSAGGYVLIRYGRRETLRGDTIEYRVNVRKPDQEGEITCASIRTPLIALENAAKRLEGERRV